MEDNQKSLDQLSYEDLKKVAGQAIEQANSLMNRLKQQEFSEAVARLQFLFKVIEFPNAFDDKFVKECAQDIKSMLVLPNKEEAAPKAPKPPKAHLKPEIVQ